MLIILRKKHFANFGKAQPSFSPVIIGCLEAWLFCFFVGGGGGVLVLFLGHRKTFYQKHDHN